MLKDSRFTEIDEEFICENCGKKVPKLGYSCRNHCPVHGKCSGESLHRLLLQAHGGDCGHGLCRWLLHRCHKAVGKLCWPVL